MILGKVKIRMVVVALVAILLTVMSQSTIAFFTVTGNSSNVVTSGTVQMVIREQVGGNSTVPDEGIYIMPGDTVAKRLWIESDCNQPFYVRVKLVYGVDSDELSAEECLSLNINPQNWEYHDGWYYYTGIVEPGGKTPNVYSEILIVGEVMDNSYLGKTLSLSVIAQGVQSKNNPLSGGKTYTAAGWPAE